MPDNLSFDPILLALLGGLLVVPLIWATYQLTSRPKKEPGETKTAHPQPAIFLYRNGFLIDANSRGLAVLETSGTDPEAWETLAHLLQTDFPDFPSTQGNKKDRDVATFVAETSKANGLVTLEQWEDFARVRLTLAEPNSPVTDVSEINSTSFGAPYPIWISDTSGEVKWANEAYMTLARKIGKRNTALPRLFAAEFEPEKTQRIEFKPVDGKETLWFDVTTRRKGSSFMHYATDANAIVRAEIAQRNFVQTLTKTFAQLSIGLAIFDRNRQLTLFNPALIDLTNLPADFLSSRPNMLTFFDRLRETRMIPEPKNYSSWRQQIAELVIAAADDRYCETWSLPSGVTYKVHGRPHPDGAIALLFEDISAEVSLTRRFRSQLDLAQAVLDSLDEAVVVFSPVGVASFSNSAYRRYWQTQPDANLPDFSIHDAIRSWREHFEPSDIWVSLEDNLTDIHPRPDLIGTVQTKAGRTKYIRAVYLHRGHKAVIFSDIPEMVSSQDDVDADSQTAYPACEEGYAV